MLINEVFSEERPWSHVDTKWTYVLFEKVENGERPRVLFTEMKERYPNADKIFKLIEKCWQTKPEDRPTMKEVIQDLHSIIQTSLNPKDDKFVEEQLEKKGIANISTELEEKLKVSPASGLSQSTNTSKKKTPPPPRRATVASSKVDEKAAPVVNVDENKFNDPIPLQYPSSKDAYASTPSIQMHTGTIPGAASPYSSSTQNYYPPASPAHSGPPPLMHSHSGTGSFHYQPNSYGAPPYSANPAPFLPTYRSFFFNSFFCFFCASSFSPF